MERGCPQPQHTNPEDISEFLPHPRFTGRYILGCECPRLQRVRTQRKLHNFQPSPQFGGAAAGDSRAPDETETLRLGNPVVIDLT